jgi:phospholipase/lecithinase/hemolysin
MINASEASVYRGDTHSPPCTTVPTFFHSAAPNFFHSAVPNFFHSAAPNFFHSAAKRRNLLLLLLLLLATTLPLPAQPARPYTQLYVFGDSYSDTGAGFPYADGPTAVARLAQRLNIPFTYYGDPAAKSKGLNFAVSAARTGANEGKREAPNALFALGMKNQVDQFAALVKSDAVHFDPAQTMFFLAGGLNDRGTPDGYTRSNEEDEIDQLYALGARRFMVALLPGKIPAFATAGTQLNPEIARIPAQERSRHPDIRIATSNWGKFFDEVITHPAQYGITNTTDACAGRPTLGAAQQSCPTPATYFYYFTAHPSAAAHRAAGDLLYTESLTSAP